MSVTVGEIVQGTIIISRNALSLFLESLSLVAYGFCGETAEPTRGLPLFSTLLLYHVLIP